MRLSASDISDLIMSFGATLIAGSILIGVLTAALRLGVRPLLADWAKLRVQPGTHALERRVMELEEELHQLRTGTNLHFPADPLRSAVRSRT